MYTWREGEYVIIGACVHLAYAHETIHHPEAQRAAVAAAAVMFLAGAHITGLKRGPVITCVHMFRPPPYCRRALLHWSRAPVHTHALVSDMTCHRMKRAGCALNGEGRQSASSHCCC